MTDTHARVSTREPAPLPQLADPDGFEARRLATLSLVGLPRSFVRGRRVLQLGGFAESALQFALWGGEVTLAESEPSAVERAERLFLRHRQRLRVESRADHLADRAAMSRFDIVVCEEPLLASSDPIGDLDTLLTSLPRDAVALVAVAETRGWSRRTIMRRITAQLATTPHERLRFALASFPRHLERTARDRGREVAAVARDLFVDARTRPSDLAEILRVFQSAGMTHLASTPSLRGWCDSAHHEMFDPVGNAPWNRLLESAWEALGASEGRSVLTGYSQLDRLIERELDALGEIQRRVARRDVDDALLQALDSGGFIDRMLVLAAKR